MQRERRPSIHVAMLAVLPALLAIAGLVASPSLADAATIIVNHTGTAQNQDADCTLVEAINNANANRVLHAGCAAGQGGGVVDTILFSIPPALCPGAVCTIQTETIHWINDPVTIDAYTQSDARPNTLAVGNNAVIRVHLAPLLSSTGVAFGINSDDVTIRGLAIGGYQTYGIFVTDGRRIRIVGCFIGTDVTGTMALQNGVAGIRVEGSVSDISIGGPGLGDRNVISGHGGGSGTGIFLYGPTSASIQNNYIGLAANGVDPLPNVVGIDSVHSESTIIGGLSAAERNVISGNMVGVRIGSNFGSSIDTRNRVMGNFIGLRADQLGVVPNGMGISISSSGNIIGGAEAGAGNRIVGSTMSNVAMINPSGGVGNAILGNAISGSGWLGIELGDFGVRANDPGDADVGPNNYQNYPVLTSVGVRVNTTVHGTLNSNPNRQYRVEVFSNAVCHQFGNGEGETYLGFVNVTTNASGNASFVRTFPPIPVGRFVTTTATDLTTNDTSEFSACFAARQAEVRATNLTGQPITSLTTTEASGSFAQFQVGLTSIPTANVTIPISMSDATEGAIVFPASPLTFTPATGTGVQQVRIVGVDDALDDGDVPYAFVLGAASSADPNYSGLDPPDIPVTNIDNDDAAVPCNPRPKVNVTVSNVGNGRLRATVAVTTNPGQQNEIRIIRWDRLDTTTVSVVDVGPIQAGQTTTFGPLTQTATFIITRTPGAQSGTVRLTVTDACGAWPTFVGGGPNAW